MYRVLLVDDEMPSLRFVDSIIEKFTKNFQVVGAVTSGEQGLQFLQQKSVDLLITDISMRGMNGIELAQAARALQPNIRIVIISGYGEFEYAQGAIKAGVDDYLLKPVSISKMTAILQALEKKMDSSVSDLAFSILPAIACGQPYAKDRAAQLYDKKVFRFALIRWGNLDLSLPKTLGATSVIPSAGEHFQALRGRDDSERVLIAPEEPMEEFLSSLSVYMTQKGNLPTWTAVYTPTAREIEALPSFIEWALTLLYRKAVIGRHQIIQFSGGASEEDHMRLPAGDLKQLSYFISAGKYRMIKEYFVSLAVGWEREQLPQRQVWHMGRQLIHQTASVYQPIGGQLEETLLAFNDLIRCAASYGELMTSTYSLLFDSGSARDRRLSTEELYEYAIQFIDDNYAQPLSMQSVCDEIGISQTYLSRLFRKYSDTTFNAYLTRRRMEAAMKLLREKPDLLLRDVAACVGYDDSSYFTKVFHQYTGKTPSQFTSGE
ncbi:MAG: response regulator [Clostridia bacterium]|nr:response regulator [Clostridia bacterium]